MTEKELLTIRKKIKKHTLKNAKLHVKYNENVINTLQELKYHFKEYSWDLDYEHYKIKTGLDSMMFNAVLELRNYKVMYSPDKLSVVIRR